MLLEVKVDCVDYMSGRQVKMLSALLLLGMPSARSVSNILVSQSDSH